MKFISRLPNYRITLRSGLLSNIAMGIPGQPGIYVKFENGEVDINKPIAGVPAEQVIEMMKRHAGYGRDRDFFDLEGNEADPYAGKRPSLEPKHVIQELDRGYVSKVEGGPKGGQADVKTLAAEIAKELVKSMLPGIKAEVMAEIKGTSEPKVEDKPKAKGGRPKKNIETKDIETEDREPEAEVEPEAETVSA